ncbi:MAG TPA: sigma-70 family RNA polymerase sigma factor [Myxococcales bacterium]|jgi:RNA polymerase sigma-70 factor (ECF subfamily)
MSSLAARLDAELLSWFALLGGPGEAASGASADEEQVEALVDAARQGDRAAGTRLYQQHVRAVFRAVRTLVRDEGEAEDVVQEAFVRALTRLDQYRPREGARFVSWVAAIGLNVARKRARWWRRAVSDSNEAAKKKVESAAGEEPDPGEQLDAARRKKALLEAMAELEPREREVVSLRYGAELSAAEVGEAMGLGEANVRKICERQRKRLLERLQMKLEEKQ